MSCYQENSRTDYLYQSPIKQLIHLGLESSAGVSRPVSQEINNRWHTLTLHVSFDNSPAAQTRIPPSGHNYSVTVNVNQVRPCRQWREIPLRSLRVLCPQPQQAASLYFDEEDNYGALFENFL